jgi:hypothetical protein
MKKLISLLAIGLLILASVVYAFADIARPKPTTTPDKDPKLVLHAGLTIVPDAKSYEARLQIPESEAKDLREALASSLSGTAFTRQSMIQRVSHSSTRTIMSGLFLFLSVSFAGVWLARAGQRRSHRVAASVVIGAAVLAAATVIVRANAGPPPGYIWRNLPQALIDGKSTSGGVIIEIVPDGVGMKLIIPLRNSKKNGEEE